MRTNRIRSVILPALLLALLLTAGCGGEETAPAASGPDQTDVDIVISQMLLDESMTDYLAGECPAEGHVWLGWHEADQEGGRWYAYLIASVGQYGFCTGHFECISGSGAIPTRLTLMEAEDGTITLEEYWEPEDGGGYADSIKEAFPQEYWDEAFDAESYWEDLTAQKEAYAAAYLESIGRTAEIGGYGDFEHLLFTDQGMSVAASNTLLEIEATRDYPFFLGNQERLEDGVRCVYTTAWDHQGNGVGVATYTKTDYATGDILQQHTYQVNGETVTEQVLQMGLG